MTYPLHLIIHEATADRYDPETAAELKAELTQ